MSINVETVDDRGNISFSNTEGVIVLFKEFDELDNPVDPSIPRYLVIPSLGVDQLIPAFSLSERRITLTAEQLQGVGYPGVRFYVVDRQGLTPVTLWEGMIRERNPGL